MANVIQQGGLVGPTKTQQKSQTRGQQMDRVANTLPQILQLMEQKRQFDVANELDVIKSMVESQYQGDWNWYLNENENTFKAFLKKSMKKKNVDDIYADMADVAQTPEQILNRIRYETVVGNYEQQGYLDPDLETGAKEKIYRERVEPEATPAIYSEDSAPKRPEINLWGGGTEDEERPKTYGGLRGEQTTGTPGEDIPELDMVNPYGVKSLEEEAKDRQEKKRILGDLPNVVVPGQSLRENENVQRYRDILASGIIEENQREPVPEVRGGQGSPGTQVRREGVAEDNTVEVSETVKGKEADETFDGRAVSAWERMRMFYDDEEWMKTEDGTKSSQATEDSKRVYSLMEEFYKDNGNRYPKTKEDFENWVRYKGEMEMYRQRAGANRVTTSGKNLGGQVAYKETVERTIDPGAEKRIAENYGDAFLEAWKKPESERTNKDKALIQSTNKTILKWATKVGLNPKTRVGRDWNYKRGAELLNEAQRVAGTDEVEDNPILAPIYGKDIATLEYELDQKKYKLQEKQFSESMDHMLKQLNFDEKKWDKQIKQMGLENTFKLRELDNKDKELLLREAALMADAAARAGEAGTAEMKKVQDMYKWYSNQIDDYLVRTMIDDNGKKIPFGSDEYFLKLGERFKTDPSFRDDYQMKITLQAKMMGVKADWIKLDVKNPEFKLWHRIFGGKDPSVSITYPIVDYSRTAEGEAGTEEEVNPDVTDEYLKKYGPKD
jgi:hypothetical protein